MNHNNFIAPRDRPRGARRRATPPGPTVRFPSGGIFGIGGLSGRGIFVGVLEGRFGFEWQFGGGSRRRTPPLGSEFVLDAEPPVFRRVPITTGNPFGIPGFGGPLSRIPQAPDVVFRPGIAGKAFNIGGLLVFGLDIFVRAALKKQQKDIDEQFESLEELERRRQRVSARDRAIRTIGEIVGTADLPTINPDRPDLPFPDVIAPVRIPLPQSLPESVPLPREVPLEITFPTISPAPLPFPLSTPGPLAIPSPVPAPVNFPNPGQFETPNPFGQPSPTPFEFPTQFPFPFAEPFPSPLTTPEPLSVPSPGAQPDFQAIPDTGASTRPTAFTSPRTAPAPTANTVDRCPPRTCEDELDEPRAECFKGLYREGVLDTDFTAWQQIDCLTGKEI